MGTTDDSLRALNQLEKAIHKQREQLLQAHGVLTCLYEVLLHEDGETAASYAQAAYVARRLIDASAADLDSVRISPLLDALGPADKVDESRVFHVN
jgi:streptomycin 6-kinase